MEYFSGGTVADRLRAAKDGGAPVPRETALRWLREAALALDAAHAADIVHRDVKPANLLLDAHDRLAVGDFGIARLADDTQMTQTGQVLGTAAYLSPEQAIGQPATAASDRYALAVVAYELLTGQRPFAGGPVDRAGAPARRGRARARRPRPRPSCRPRSMPSSRAGWPRTRATARRPPSGSSRRSSARWARRRRRSASTRPGRWRRSLPRRGRRPPLPPEPATAARPAPRAHPLAAAARRRPPPPPAAAPPPPPAPAAAPRRPRRPRPSRRRRPHRRRQAAPWLPIGVAAAAIAAVVLAIALASGGGGGGDGERASTTTPKKSHVLVIVRSSQKTARRRARAAGRPRRRPRRRRRASTSGDVARGAQRPGLRAHAGAATTTAAVPLLQRSVEGFRDSRQTARTATTPSRSTTSATR